MFIYACTTFVAFQMQKINSRSFIMNKHELTLNYNILIINNNTHYLSCVVQEWTHEE